MKSKICFTGMVRPPPLQKFTCQFKKAFDNGSIFSYKDMLVIKHSTVCGQLFNLAGY